ncbi:hypothetical protein MASR2M39_29940 [Ignavibacteriales bacterium]
MSLEEKLAKKKKGIKFTMNSLDLTKDDFLDDIKEFQLRVLFKYRSLGKSMKFLILKTLL